MEGDEGKEEDEEDLGEVVSGGLERLAAHDLGVGDPGEVGWCHGETQPYNKIKYPTITNHSLAHRSTCKAW